VPSSGRRHRCGASLTAVALALSLGACDASSSATGSAAVAVVASTDVYGDVVTQIAGRLAGNRVAITSVIDDPSADPHSYEANTRTQLAISHADLLIENGGGYDDFMSTMRRSAHADAVLLNVVALSGRRAPAGGDLNEHVWFDLPTVGKLVDRIVTVLSAKDATDAAAFRANAASFKNKLTGLERAEASLKSAHAGAGVAITEPVPLYLLQACGLVNRTPPEFSRAVEDGTDVAPRVLRRTIALFSTHQVKLLVYNEQTAGPVTTKILAAARAASIPVVPVSETLPEHSHYLREMGSVLNAVRSALDAPSPAKP
jgi:zinc/manganese transport system substrate-binding protein